jgi:hypothetical protein
MAFVEVLVSAGFYMFQAGLAESGLMILNIVEEICDLEVSSHPLSVRGIRHGIKSAESADPWSPPEAQGASGPLDSWTKLQATASHISWAIMVTSHGITPR